MRIGGEIGKEDLSRRRYGDIINGKGTSLYYRSINRDGCECVTSLAIKYLNHRGINFPGHNIDFSVIKSHAPFGQIPHPVGDNPRNNGNVTLPYGRAVHGVLPYRRNYRFLGKHNRRSQNKNKKQGKFSHGSFF